MGETRARPAPWVDAQTLHEKATIRVGELVSTGRATVSEAAARLGVSLSTEVDGQELGPYQRWGDPLSRRSYDPYEAARSARQSQYGSGTPRSTFGGTSMRTFCGRQRIDRVEIWPARNFWKTSKVPSAQEFATMGHIGCTTWMRPRLVTVNGWGVVPAAPGTTVPS
jgi:hypothetical protein